MPILSSGSFDLLSVQPGLVFWTFITFSIVMIVLWRFAWKPIISAIDDRNARVEDDLKSSEKLRKDAESLLEQYESKLDTAKKEISDMLDASKKDAEHVRDKIIGDAQGEAGNVKERAQHDIEQAKLKAVKEIQELAVDISMTLLSNVLKTDISDKDHKKLIIQELDKLKSNN